MIPSQMLKGVLEGCILKVIQEEETYAYEISEKLKAYGFGDISEGTIYPIILRLNKRNLIEGTLHASPKGPKRKYYHLTDRGKEELETFEENWHHLQEAIEHLFNGGNKNE